MKMFVLVATAAALCLAMPANAKTPDDRFCGMILPEEATEPQLVLFKLKKSEELDPELVKVIKENGGDIECGAEMRATHQELKKLKEAQQIQNWNLRNRMLNDPFRHERLRRLLRPR